MEREPRYTHIPVFLNEAIDLLDIKPDGIYIDATAGLGGHSVEILKRLTTGHLYCFDLDFYALQEAHAKLSKISKNFTCINKNFATLYDFCKEQKITQFDGILYDLGVSSLQFDMPERGFSYRENSRLDMRMSLSAKQSAYDVVMKYTVEMLTEVFRDFGEEPYAKEIAEAIIQARYKYDIDTTFQLVDIIKSALPAKVLSKKGHPAKRVFQALRMEVNKELDSIEASIIDALELLKIGGRAVVITFHSLEDRLVKNIFKAYTRDKNIEGLPIMSDEMPEYDLLLRKALKPTEEMIAANRRCHSAKLRAVVRKEKTVVE